VTATEPLRVLVIGTGFGARGVAPAFGAVDGCEVVDVVSARDAGAVSGAVRRRDLDLVCVHSPPFLHRRYVEAAVDEGHAVLCDKPFGTSATDARALYDAAEQARVAHFSNFEFRYEPARAIVRGLLRDGAIGSLEHVQWTHLGRGSREPMRAFGWLFDAEMGGGWVGAWASHAIDTLRWLGEEVTGVVAQRRTDIATRPDRDGVERECTAEDGLTAALTLASGATVAIDSGFAASIDLAPRLTLAGSAGMIECVADRRVELRRSNGERTTYEPPDEGGHDRHLVPMRRWAEVVCRALRSGEVPDGAPTFADGYACALVLDQLRASPRVVRH
jgi:predicted dehydrogenase